MLSIKAIKLLIGVILTALAVAVSAQSPRPVQKTSATVPVEKTSAAVPVEKTSAVSVSSVAATSAFATAATTNVTLRNDLTWSFGGKQQRGWYLYDLLIGETLNSKDDPLTSDFASSVATWQKQRGIRSDGILDQEAWMAMVSQWQGNRLKNRAYATPDQLLTAPSSDFYDPSRAEELRQVERSTYAAYKEMIAAAIADPTLKLEHTSTDQLAPDEQYFKIISAFRSREYQEALRRKSPNAGSAGLAVNNSPHFTGRALDLYVGGDPVDTKDANRAIQVNTPAYRWLVKNAGRFGFRPYFYEPWHWEYVR